MAKKKETPTQLKDELRKARSAARNASNRLKAYKEGIQEGIRLAREAGR